MASVGLHVSRLLATGLIALGGILNIVSLATVHWYRIGVPAANRWEDYGLFKICDALGVCAEIDDTGFGKIYSDEHIAVRATIIAGLLVGAAGLFVAVMLVLSSILGKTLPKLFPVLCLGICCAAGALTLVGVVVYGVTIYDKIYANRHVVLATMNLGYSFALAVISILLIPGGGFFIFVTSIIKL